MGDSKRNSVAGKVATPKTGGSSPAMQPLADPLETLGKAIGGRSVILWQRGRHVASSSILIHVTRRVKVTTVAPHSQTIEGSLFTADPVLNVIAINSRSPSTNSSAQPGDYHIIPVTKIQNVQIVSLPAEGDGSFAGAQPAVGPIDTRRLKQREETRVARLKEEEQNRGKGVSREAQAIFDSLRRM